MAETVNERLSRLEEVVVTLADELAAVRVLAETESVPFERSDPGYVNPNPVKDESNG